MTHRSRRDAREPILIRTPKPGRGRVSKRCNAEDENGRVLNASDRSGTPEHEDQGNWGGLGSFACAAQFYWSRVGCQQRRKSLRPPPSPPHSGVGLHIMNYRAGMIGGSLEVRREPPQGTTTFAGFPSSSTTNPREVKMIDASATANKSRVFVVDD